MKNGKNAPIERMNILAVHFRKSRVATLDRRNHVLQIHKSSQVDPIFEVKDIPSMLKLRDLLNDAYPLDKYKATKEGGAFNVGR
ncbi:hypothetical protein J2T13_000826 [Paenibacillus sp. DS2015]|uniref:hypothetical protein n=1 Tax=Paenibacillus sp. DS2015 TaxID=3373917 RepID=UPI003D19D2FC